MDEPSGICIEDPNTKAIMPVDLFGFGSLQPVLLGLDAGLTWPCRVGLLLDCLVLVCIGFFLLALNFGLVEVFVWLAFKPQFRFDWL